MCNACSLAPEKVVSLDWHGRCIKCGKYFLNLSGFSESVKHLKVSESVLHPRNHNHEIEIVINYNSGSGFNLNIGDTQYVTFTTLKIISDTLRNIILECDRIIYGRANEVQD